MNKSVAIIPARGGSKGIPGKNIMDFCGKPLIAWSVLQALSTKEIKTVYVTSDSDEILRTAEQYGAKGIKRPDELAGDKASSESALEHALTTIGSIPELVVFLQPTSPLRKPSDLTGAIQQFRSDEYDSLFSAAVLDDFLIWEKTDAGAYTSLNYDYKSRGRRQDRKPQYVENGSFYIFKPEILIKGKNRLGGKIGIFLMEFWQSFEIDTLEDLALVKNIFEYKLKHHLGD